MRRMSRDGGESDIDAGMTAMQAIIATFTDVKVLILIVALTTQVIGSSCSLASRAFLAQFRACLSFNAFFPTCAPLSRRKHERS